MDFLPERARTGRLRVPGDTQPLQQSVGCGHAVDSSCPGWPSWWLGAVRELIVLSDRKNGVLVVQGQSAGEAARYVGHRSLALVDAGADPEDRARVIQGADQLPNSLPLAGRDQLRRIAAGEPAHRHGHSGRHDRVDVNDRVELDLRAHLHTRPVEHDRSGRDPGVTLDDTAGQRTES